MSTCRYKRCDVGDVILVKASEIVTGEDRTISFDWRNRRAMSLGTQFVYPGHPAEYVPCLVIEKFEFPNKVKHIFNYMHVIFSGGTGYVYDDQHNGYWLPLEHTADDMMYTRRAYFTRKMFASTRYVPRRRRSTIV